MAKLTEEEKENRKAEKEHLRNINKISKLKEKLTEKYSQNVGEKVSTQLATNLGVIDKQEYRLYGKGGLGGLMVIIDYPTVREDKIDTICYGTPRRIIDKIIAKSYTKQNIYWTSAAKVGINKKSVDMGVWKPYIENFEEEVEIVKPKLIICLGGIALSTVLKSKKGLAITNNHGRMYELKFNYGTCLMIATYNPYTLLKDDMYGRDIIRDIDRLLSKQPTVYPKPSVIFDAPATDKQLIKALNTLNGQAVISCDIETTSKNAYNGSIESIGFGTLNGYNVIVNHLILKELWCKELIKRFLTNCKPKLVFHNAKFDVKWLELYIDGKMTSNIADTMLMNYCLDERPIGSKYSVQSLKDLSRIYFDAEDYHFNFNKWNQTIEEERDYISYWQYQCLDLQYTIRLYDVLLKMLEEEPRILKMYNTLIIPALHLFIDAEKYGFKVNVEYLQELHSQYTIKTNKLLDEIRALMPDMPDFKPTSSVQVHDYLVSIGIEAGARRTTNQGVNNQGTAKDEMLQYIASLEKQCLTIQTHEELVKKYDQISILKKIMELRQVAKLNTTYFKGLLDKVDYDGRVRTDIRIAGTTTGRLSSGEPNLQNIPSRLKIDGKDASELVKSAFVASEGYTLLEVDYAQLELRMAAYLSKDEVMAKLFREGTDMHKVVAGKMFHKDPKEVTKNERYLAKAIGFGILYGRGAAALVDGVEMDFYVAEGGTRATVKEMQKFIDDFLNQFPTLKQWIADVQDAVMYNQEVQTIFGRKRRFSIILPDVSKQNEVRRQAVNTLIQSGASDLCLSAAISIDKYLKHKYPNDAHFLLSVHDSIMVECKHEVVTPVLKAIKHFMEKGVINDSFIPFTTEAKAGLSWGTCKEIE